MLNNVELYAELYSTIINIHNTLQDIEDLAELWTLIEKVIKDGLRRYRKYKASITKSHKKELNNTETLTR